MTKPEYLKLKPQHSQHRRIVCVACALLDHALAQTKQFFSKTGYIFSISQQQKKDWAPVFHLIVAVRVDEISDFPNLTKIFAIMWTAEISKKKDENILLNSHRPSKWFLFRHKQLSQTCLALKEVSSFSHGFCEGNCTKPISSPGQKRLKFWLNIIKMAQTTKKKLFSIQTSTFLWQLQDQAH